VTVSGLPFTSYDATAPEGARGEATASIACDLDCPAQVIVRLGPGMNDASLTERRMRHADSDALLAYDLTIEAEGGASGTSVPTPVQPGVAIPFRIIGVIPSGQDAPIGRYSDRVTVFLDF